MPNHKITFDIDQSTFEAYQGIKESLGLSHSRTFRTLVESYIPASSSSQGVTELRKSLEKNKQVFPVVRQLRLPTSELKDGTDILMRRRDTHQLLLTSVPAVNGGEWEYPMADFFTRHEEQLTLVLNRVDGGNFFSKLREQTLSQVCKASLLDFLQLLDRSNGSINVSGLRAVHKLMVIFSFSFFLSLDARSRLCFFFSLMLGFHSQN